MEGKEEQRFVVSRPVASRPSCSGFTTTYSELLSRAIDASPPRASRETVTTFAVRPKTVRLKPSGNCLSVGAVQSQASGTASTGAPTRPSSSGRGTKAEERPNVVYKPLAKLVSREAVALLATMENFDRNGIASSSLLGASLSTQSPTNKEHEPASLRTSIQNDDDQNNTVMVPPLGGDRVSFDGYNWRKYGQKQVKGSQYPRSYYKCTHPSCPVKKKVERSLDGKIAEIVYKGEHNHRKLQPPSRTSPEGQMQLHSLEGPAGDIPHSTVGFHLEKNEENDGEMGKQRETENNQSSLIKLAVSYDPVKNHLHNTGSASRDNSCGLSEECETRSRGEDDNDEEPASNCRKQRKITEIGAEQDTQGLVQSNVEPEILEDGFRWRKYGQKVVKGNPFPRSYYRCTNLKCNVRKHVEHSSSDPTAFITTYEGKHNHEMPVTRSSMDASDTDAHAQ